MTELPELKKLADIATDLEFPSKLRLDAIDQLGTIGSHDALLALLNLAANDKLEVKEREAALKQARKIVRASH